MQIHNVTISKDKTKKISLLTKDNFIIEACVVFFEHREAKAVICVSSQIGCTCNCCFCVCGNKRFIRNLTKNEIYEQLLLILKEDHELLSKVKIEITFMGTGEPLCNFENVKLSAEKMSANIINLYKINISTILPTISIPIEKIAKLNNRTHLQFSMHFVDDIRRKKFFRKDLPTIESSLKYLDDLCNFINDTYCINYILFDEINDSKEDALNLCEIVSHHNAYLKVSEYTPLAMDCCSLRPSLHKSEFIRVVKSNNIEYKEFQSKGVDIHAACGHLLEDIDF